MAGKVRGGREVARLDEMQWDRSHFLAVGHKEMRMENCSSLRLNNYQSRHIFNSCDIDRSEGEATYENESNPNSDWRLSGEMLAARPLEPLNAMTIYVRL